MKDRLLKFLNKEQLSSARFAEIIGVQPSSVSHILSGRNKPGFDFIQKILINFPSLNADWLIMGKGNIYRNFATQRDLFSDSGYAPKDQSKTPDNLTNTSSDNDNPDDDDTNIQSKDNLENSDTFVNKTSVSEDYKSNLSSISGITNVNSRKSVARIVIFYSDKSFDEYFPA